MENSSENQPNISGVPEEIQEKIIKDLGKSLSNNQAVNRKRVAISVSDNEDLALRGFSTIHLRDLTIELVRHLLINNIITVYGGDLRKEGYTEIFSDLAFQYRSIGESKEDFFENYFAFPIYKDLSKKHELDFKRNRTKIFRVKPPENIGLMPNSDISENNLDYAKSLSKMRSEMTAAIDARVLVGGKCRDYAGVMPGIIEEAKLTLEQKKPIYLIGALGGATNQVIKALKGEKFDFISNEYKEVKNKLDSEAGNKTNFAEIELFFKHFGLNQLSTTNGLSIEENLRLMETVHLSEMLYYVFKGLVKRFNE